MAVILCCNYDEKALARLRVIALRCGASVKPVPAGDYSKTLSSILEGGNDSGEGGDFQDRMIVLCGFDGARCDRFLRELRTAKLSAGVLKAVLTETNADWSIAQLHNELCAERDAIAEGQRAHAEQ